jgi:nitroimidazol reductase NimA-like FMN-containing flavoprotein (pyridoxamine 5'-phosphate oxidase superfamily)
MEASFAELRSRNITKQLPADELKQRATDFLKSQNVCVLCTSKGDVPRATPIEYYSEGTTVYMIAQESTKTENIKANPKVSIGIYNTPYTDWIDWYKVVGVQVTGVARLLTDGDPEYDDAFKVYKWQLYAKARGWDLNTPPQVPIVIKVEAQKIEYRELALLAKGYSATQVWEAPEK